VQRRGKNWGNILSGNWETKAERRRTQDTRNKAVYVVKVVKVVMSVK
jgi:hypothetical protein